MFGTFTEFTFKWDCSDFLGKKKFFKTLLLNCDSWHSFERQIQTRGTHEEAARQHTLSGSSGFIMDSK